MFSLLRLANSRQKAERSMNRQTDKWTDRQAKITLLLRVNDHFCGRHEVQLSVSTTRFVVVALAKNKLKIKLKLN